MKTKNVCCEINCKDEATIHIQEQGKADEYTHVCDKHLAEFIAEGKTIELWRIEQ